MREEREGDAVFVQPEGDLKAVVAEEDVHYGTPTFNEPVPMAIEEDSHISSQFLTEEVEPGKTKIGQTPNGKTVQIYKLADTTGYGIQFAEGGENPPEFQGKWTSYSKAELDARIYLQKRWDEVSGETPTS